MQQVVGQRAMVARESLLGICWQQLLAAAHGGREVAGWLLQVSQGVCCIPLLQKWFPMASPLPLFH
jgi:hypothetical protein